MGYSRGESRKVKVASFGLFFEKDLADSTKRANHSKGWGAKQRVPEGIAGLPKERKGSSAFFVEDGQLESANR